MVRQLGKQHKPTEATIGRVAEVSLETSIDAALRMSAAAARADDPCGLRIVLARLFDQETLENIKVSRRKS